MKIRYRYARPIPERLHTLEDPGKPLAFDADREFIRELSERCNVRELVASLAGKGEEEVEAACRDFGHQLMEATIELADGKYLDRAGEVIERVAQQTGISFPHRFQRYVELSILGSRPMDRWNIAKSTTKELVLQIFSCAVRQEAEKAGLAVKDAACHALCLASFQRAAQKTGDNLEMQVLKTLTKDGRCEFSFLCRQP